MDPIYDINKKRYRDIKNLKILKNMHGLKRSFSSDSIEDRKIKIETIKNWYNKKAKKN